MCAFVEEEKTVDAKQVESHKLVSTIGTQCRPLCPEEQVEGAFRCKAVGGAKRMRVSEA